MTPLSTAMRPSAVSTHHDEAGSSTRRRGLTARARFQLVMRSSSRAQNEKTREGIAGFIV
jgi:hypothetical protein